MSKTVLNIAQRAALATLLLATVSACSSSDTPQANAPRDASTVGSPINNGPDPNINNRNRGN